MGRSQITWIFVAALQSCNFMVSSVEWWKHLKSANLTYILKITAAWCRVDSWEVKRNVFIIILSGTQRDWGLLLGCFRNLGDIFGRQGNGAGLCWFCMAGAQRYYTPCSEWDASQWGIVLHVTGLLNIPTGYEWRWKSLFVTNWVWILNLLYILLRRKPQASKGILCSQNGAEDII